MASSVSDLENARYGLSQARFQLQNLVVDAPFSGFVEEVFVEEGEYIARPGSRLAQIVHLDRFLVVTYISENEIQTLRNAKKILGEVTNFKEINLTLRSISTLPNPATNTFKVELSFNFSGNLGDERDLKEGLSAEIKVVGSSEEATKIPVSIFVLNDEGVLGVRGVSSDSKVLFFPIRILKEMDGFAWVLGVPKNTPLIVAGFENTAEGSSVKIDSG